MDNKLIGSPIISNIKDARNWLTIIWAIHLLVMIFVFSIYLPLATFYDDRQSTEKKTQEKKPNSEQKVKL